MILIYLFKVTQTSRFISTIQSISLKMQSGSFSKSKTIESLFYTLFTVEASSVVNLLRFSIISALPVGPL